MATEQTRLSRIARSGLLFLLAMVGVIALIFTLELPASLIEASGLTEQTLKLASLAQSTVMVIIAVLIGSLTAHRVGLTSLIVHTNNERQEKPSKTLIAFLIYALIGILFGLCVAIGDGFLMQNIASLNALAQSPALASLPQPGLATRFLYGGITEEVLLRWGLMSLFAAILFALFKNKSISIGIAIIITALLFGIGHLPALHSFLDEVPPALTIRTIGLNALLGVFYGITYARRNLETSMVAHAATHIGLLLAPILGLVGPLAI